MSAVAIFGTMPLVIPLMSGIALMLYLAYRWALPKPIPGIPHNPNATKSILGDMPDMMAHMNRTGQVFEWVSKQNVQLNSPIVQLFTRPFSKPWVVVTDFKESQDILMRRTREFDRSDFFGDVFTGLLPDHHISKKSMDEKFKSNRHLMKDLMTPAFLNQVAAPQVYSAVSTLLDLWTVKMKVAQGRPFLALTDIYNGALDAIFAATFGLEEKNSTTTSQLELISSSKNIPIPADMNKPVVFPAAPHPASLEAILTLTDSLEASIKSPLPRLHHWVLRQLPSIRRAIAEKENLINEELKKGMERFSEGDQVKRCALDDIMHRELSAAKKEGRAPIYQTRAIYDELFGFLIAGHDTTSTTANWGLKRLADNQSAQKTLRSELRKAYTSATAEQRNPTIEEITKSHIPYLDAAIEEIVRTSVTTSGVIRNALVDTTILGHHIPKGTDVFLMGNGPDFFTAPFEIKDEQRSESARSTKGRKVGSWDPSSMPSFTPERWLTKDEEGKEIFDAMAGPLLTFGLGPRGCYGKRLAYLELRTLIVMIVWNFELQQCPEELSSYAGYDKLTRQPQQCYVRLAKAAW